MKRLAALAFFIAMAATLLSACGDGGGSTQTPGAPTETVTAPSGGEKSIEEFGSEAEGSSRASVLGVFTGYLDALAAKDYAGACDHLGGHGRRLGPRALRRDARPVTRSPRLNSRH